jgi:hypothetical protein
MLALYRRDVEMIALQIVQPQAVVNPPFAKVLPGSRITDNGVNPFFSAYE